MRIAILSIGLVLSLGACKKSGGGGGGGSGSGEPPGSWLVGTEGMMLNVLTDGTATGYDTGSTETFNGIACRYSGEAWVVGTRGTLLYTEDAGASWRPQQIPTTADLRALATQDWGPVYVAGDGVFFVSTDTGASWRQLGDSTTSFRSLAAAQEAETVLAVSEDGSLWSYEHAQLVKRGGFPGARAVAVSPDGKTAVLVGANMVARSVDAGRTWTPLAGAGGVRYDDVRLDAEGRAVAVGTAGTIAHIAASGEISLQHVGAADLHTVHITAAGDEYENLGIAAGEGGAVWMTSDGGWTWTEGPNAGHTVLGVDQIGDGHR
jgi:photosystem II stability/assembly factor-like uncharacterized protein